jgi:hypothetical protein
MVILFMGLAADHASGDVLLAIFNRVIVPDADGVGGGFWRFGEFRESRNSPASS